MAVCSLLVPRPSLIAPSTDVRTPIARVTCLLVLKWTHSQPTVLLAILLIGCPLAQIVVMGQTVNGPETPLGVSAAIATPDSLLLTDPMTVVAHHHTKAVETLETIAMTAVRLTDLHTIAMLLTVSHPTEIEGMSQLALLPLAHAAAATTLWNNQCQIGILETCSIPHIRLVRQSILTWGGSIKIIHPLHGTQRKIPITVG